MKMDKICTKLIIRNTKIDVGDRSLFIARGVGWGVG